MKVQLLTIFFLIALCLAKTHIRVNKKVSSKKGGDAPTPPSDAPTPPSDSTSTSTPGDAPTPPSSSPSTSTSTTSTLTDEEIAAAAAEKQAAIDAAIAKEKAAEAAAAKLLWSGKYLNYRWETTNTNDYICSSDVVKSQAGFNSHVVCAQTEFPKTVGGSAFETPELTCPEGEVIKCFAFASYGYVGGRCDGDGYFHEDPAAAGEYYNYFPADKALKAIGQNSLTLDCEAGDYINGEYTPLKSRYPTTMHESVRLKVVALCETSSTAMLQKKAKKTTTMKKITKKNGHQW
jgi:hypothetical protein